jgi:hypothetical protein
MVCRLLSVLIGCVALLGCGADMTSQVKDRAARDLSCGADQTQVVDAEGGVYRIAGCGLEASYHCTEDTGLNTRCQRLYLTKTAPEPATKPGGGSDLAKSQ